MTSRISQVAKQITSKMAEKSNIHLYTAQTPNGIKASIVLEELGLKYEVCASKSSARRLFEADANANM
jgi:glutathione S-transferase